MHAGPLYGQIVLSPESAIAASVGSLPISIGQGKTSRTTQEPGWEEHWLASGTRRINSPHGGVTVLDAIFGVFLRNPGFHMVVCRCGTVVVPMKF